MKNYGSLFLGAAHQRRLRRQGDRHQPHAADQEGRALHRRAVGREVPQDLHLPEGADRPGQSPMIGEVLLAPVHPRRLLGPRRAGQCAGAPLRRPQCRLCAGRRSNRFSWIPMIHYRSDLTLPFAVMLVVRTPCRYASNRGATLRQDRDRRRRQRSSLSARRIRVQGNFTEYVPMALILLLRSWRCRGWPRWLVHAALPRCCSAARAAARLLASPQEHGGHSCCALTGDGDHAPISACVGRSHGLSL